MHIEDQNVELVKDQGARLGRTELALIERDAVELEPRHIIEQRLIGGGVMRM
jgi:hypothetical protein